jgi:Tfp pilus assembly protein PilO
MTRFLLPIIFLIISGGLFFLYIDPEVKNIKEVKKEEQLFSSALDNSKELQSIRDDVLSKYNSFSKEDLNKIEKMLPNTIDNVRLVRDINEMAFKYGMTLRNVTVDTNTDSSSNKVGPDDNTVGTMTLGFSVAGPYKVFLSFMKDLENSMRISDVTEVSFISSEKDLYEYKISLKTYWIK